MAIARTPRKWLKMLALLCVFWAAFGRAGLDGCQAGSSGVCRTASVPDAGAERDGLDPNRYAGAAPGRANALATHGSNYSGAASDGESSALSPEAV
jgi:hypothetical protein